jgi:hypothetical protein
MIIFINETSLSGQYYSSGDFEKAILVFYSILRRLQSLDIPKTFYKDSLIENCYAISVINLKSSLNQLTDKIVKENFIRLLFNKTNPIDWRLERKHFTYNSYIYNSIQYSDTTIGEISERIFQKNNENYLLLNFSDSIFRDAKILNIEKNNINKINVECSDNENDLEQWIEEKYKLSRIIYNEDSTVPPTDLQTILRDNKRFIKTNLRSKDDRSVFKEIDTNYFWYVDNFHFGRSAHIEVFNIKHNHVGEANLAGIIDRNKKDKTKKFKD